MAGKRGFFHFVKSALFALSIVFVTNTAFAYDFHIDLKPTTISFHFTIRAKGTFDIACNNPSNFAATGAGTVNLVVDNADGTTTLLATNNEGSSSAYYTVTHTSTEAKTYTCGWALWAWDTYENKSVSLGGRATDYSDSLFSAEASVIDFEKGVHIGGASDDPNYTYNECATSSPTNSCSIIGVRGNLSRIFPYIPGNTPYGAQPRFAYTFQATKNMTDVPDSLFADYTTPSAGMFYGTFFRSGLTSIPAGLFNRITTGNEDISYVFANTFYASTSLTSIPASLFTGVTKAGFYMFQNTFLNANSLTSIPDGLFANVSSGSTGSFLQTFESCDSLTSIPNRLFAGLTDASEDMFDSTFEDCTNLSGYIPASAFAGLIANGSPTATNMWGDTFRRTNLSTSCSSPNVQYTTGYESEWSRKVSCISPIHVFLYDGSNVTTYVAPSSVYLRYKDGWYAGYNDYTQIPHLATIPKKTNSSFMGFYTAPSGGIQVVDSAGNFLKTTDALSFTTNSYAVVYAQWTPEVINCSLGQYLPAGGTTCVVCPAGKYCSGGNFTYNGTAAQGLGGDVSAGYFSSGGAKNATPGVDDCIGENNCGVVNGGYYSTGGATTNTGNGVISAGYFSSGGAKTATPTSSSDCVSGFNCGVISAGYFSTGGARNATPRDSSTDIIRDCPIGYSCGPVAAGYFSTGGATKKTPNTTVGGTNGDGTSSTGCLSGYTCGAVSGGYFSTGGATKKNPNITVGGTAGDGTDSTGCLTGYTCGRVSAGSYSSGGGTVATPTDSTGCLSGNCGKVAAGYYSTGGASNSTAGSKSVAAGYFSTCGATKSDPSSSDCLSGCECGSVSKGYYSSRGAKKNNPTSNSDCVGTCGQCKTDYSTASTGATSVQQCYKTGTTTCATAVPYSNITISNGSVNYRQVNNNSASPSSVAYKQFQVDANTVGPIQLDNPSLCLNNGITCNSGYTTRSSSFSGSITNSSSVDSLLYYADSTNSSYDSNGLGLGPGQFWVSFDAATKILYGQAVASTTSGSVGGTTTSISSTSGTNCWCKLTGYDYTSLHNNDLSYTHYVATSPWINVGTISNNSCASMCAGAIGHSSDVRNAVINSGTTYYYCGTTAVYGHTLDTAGGTGVSPVTVFTRQGEGVYNSSTGAQNMTSSDKITHLTNLPKKANYTFKGFYDSAVGGTQVVDATGNFTTAAKNSTVTTWYAQWDLLYTLTLDKNGGTNGTDALYINDSGVYSDVYGSVPWTSSHVDIPSKIGYDFGGYYFTGQGYGGTNYNNYQVFNSSGNDTDWNVYPRHMVGDADATFTARWTAKSIQCEAGQYLRASDASCQSCPAGKYCWNTSKTWTYDGSDQGIRGDVNGGYYATCGAKYASPTSNSSTYCLTGESCSCGKVSTGYYSAGGAKKSQPTSSDDCNGNTCGKCMNNYNTASDGSKSPTACFKNISTTCANVVPYSNITVSNGVKAYANASGTATFASTSIAGKQFQSGTNSVYSIQPTASSTCILSGLTCDTGYKSYSYEGFLAADRPSDSTYSTSTVMNQNDSSYKNGLGLGQLSVGWSSSGITLYMQAVLAQDSASSIGTQKPSITPATGDYGSCWCKLNGAQVGSTYYAATSNWISGYAVASQNLSNCTNYCAQIGNTNSDGIALRDAFFNYSIHQTCTATSSNTHSLNVNGGDTVSPSTVYTRYGEGVYKDSLSYAQSMNASYKITKLTTLPKKANNTFKGFYNSTSGTTQYVAANGNFTTNAKNTTTNNTWYAQWEPLKTLTLAKGDGTNDATYFYFNSTGIYKDIYGTEPVSWPISVPSRTGFNFTGYFYTGGNQVIDSNGEDVSGGFFTYYLLQSSTAAQTITAQWTATTSYTHSLNVNGGDTVSPSTVYTRYGDAVYKDSLSYAQSMNASYKITQLTTLPKKANNKFKGFYDSSSGGIQVVDASGNFTTAAKDSTAATWYAQWQPLYTLTLAKSDGTHNESYLYFNSTGLYSDIYGKQPVSWPISVPTRTGYDFTGYYYNGDNIIVDPDGYDVSYGFFEQYLEPNITEPMALTAGWENQIITCNRGYYLQASTATCQACPAGKYCSGSDNTSYLYINNTDQGIIGDMAAGYFSQAGAYSATPNETVGGESGQPNGNNGCVVNGRSCGKISAGYYSTGGGTINTPNGEGDGCLESHGTYSCGYCVGNTQYSTGGASSCSTVDTGYHGINCDPNDDRCTAQGPNTHTISYVLNGGTAGADAPTSATFDSQFHVTNPTRSGWTFAGWTISGMEAGITHYYGSSSATTTFTTTTPSKSYTYFKNLSATSGSTVTFTARWTKSCNSGTYYHLASDSCATCTSGNYCPGTTVNQSVAANAGLETCNKGSLTGMTSPAGALSRIQCYKTGTTTCANANPIAAVSHASGATYATSGNVACKQYLEFNSDTLSSCIPDAGVCDITGLSCDTGYSSTLASSTYLGSQSISEPYEDYNWFAINGIDFEGNERDGLSNGEYSATYTYGTVRGRAMCSSTSGTNGAVGTPANTNGQYCWCKITKASNSTMDWMPTTSAWVYYSDGSGSDYDNCAESCPHNCPRVDDNAVLSTLYNSAVQYECTPNTYTVTYAGNGNTSGSVPSNHTCSYGGTCIAGVQGTLLKTNNTFGGWSVSCMKSDGTTACTPSVQTIAAGGDLQNVTAENGAIITLTAIWNTCTECSATNANCNLSVVNNVCTYETSCQGGYGTLSNAGEYNPSCTQCAAGTYSADGDNICSICAKDTYSDYGATSCSACNTTNGYGNSGDTATAHAGVTSCKTTCSAGYAVLEANAACATVRGNRYQTGNHTVTYGSTTPTSADVASPVAGKVYTCPAETGIAITENMLEQGGIVDATGYNADGLVTRVRIKANEMLHLNPGTYNITFNNNASGSITARGFYRYTTPDNTSSAIKTDIPSNNVIINGSKLTLTEPAYIRISFQKSNNRTAVTTTEVVNAQPVLTRSTAYAISGTAATDHDAKSDCKITCPTGTYVASSGGACVPCANGKYCLGGTIAYGSTLNQSSCSTGYTNSDNGRDATTDCFLTTARGNYVATAKGNQVICAENGYCPAETKVYYNSTGGRTACGTGLVAPAGSYRAAQCGHKLHVGDDVIYLHSDKVTTPSLNVKWNNQTWYANTKETQTNMSNASSHKLKVQWGTGANQKTYYVCDDTICDQYQP